MAEDVGMENNLRSQRKENREQSNAGTPATKQPLEEKPGLAPDAD